MSRLKILLLSLLLLVPVLTGAARAGGLPPGASLRSDVAYGPDRDQRMDIYLPAPVQGQAQNAPILFMVHGGGWKWGDKEMARVVDNKVARWLPRGIVVVSVNYRMLPQATALTQAEDVATALARLQALAPSFGGDAKNVILMGHSAGGHLVALLNAAPELATARGALPWRGTVSLDAAALDVPAIMQKRHFRFYDQAFGKDPATWAAASPYHRLNGATPPLLAVCRQDKEPCAEARAYAAKATGFGNRVEILPQAKKHGAINEELGEPGAYTEAVEAFLRSLGWQL
jgi:acetyl esterase/lipase